MKRMTRGQKIFNVFNIAFMILLMIVTIYPFHYILVASFSDSTMLKIHRGFLLTPLNPTLGAYRKTFNHPLIISGFANILKIMAIALPINILFTLVGAFFMSQKGMRLKKPIVFMMMFTMYFGGGLIPEYLNIRELGLYGTHWALILPGCISVYNTIIMKTAIEGLPESLQESAYIDGANDFMVLFRIIVPLIIPTIAVILLYYGVGHWNSWFPATIYLDSNEKLPIQAVLRSILIENEQLLGGSTEVYDGLTYANDYTETIKYSIMVISLIPILCVYPFLQRYFIKGVLIGAVKG